MNRYQVQPIADEECTALSGDVLCEFDDLAAAQAAADDASAPFGAGILDVTTGKIDVGFGFGVAAPALPA